MLYKGCPLIKNLLNDPIIVVLEFYAISLIYLWGGGQSNLMAKRLAYSMTKAMGVSSFKVIDDAKKWIHLS